MNHPTLFLASLALVCLPCAGETLRVKGDFQSQPVSGTAQLDLNAPASLRLKLGDQAWTLRGYPIEDGAYAFVEEPATGGIAQIVSEVVPTSKQQAVVVASVLNVRPSPTLDSIPSRQAARGDVLALSGVKEGPWLQLADGSSWVHGASKYVRVEALYDADTIPSAGLKLLLRPRSGGYYGTIGMEVLRFVRITPAGPPRALLIPTVHHPVALPLRQMGNQIPAGSDIQHLVAPADPQHR